MALRKRFLLCLLTAILLCCLGGCEIETQQNISGRADIYTDAEENESRDNASMTDASSDFEASAGKASSRKTSSAKPSVADEKSPVSSTQGKVKTINIRKSNLSSFKTVGRCGINNSLGLTLPWSCSSVAFDLECAGDVVLQFRKASPAKSVWIEISVDGQAIDGGRTEISAGNAITVAQNLPQGLHRIQMVRQSDCEAPLLTLESIQTTGSLAPAPSNGRLYIEAIGDAALLGLGVRLKDSFFGNGFDQTVVLDRAHEDGTLSYPYVAAEKLSADCYILARRGVGIAATFYVENTSYQGKTVLAANAAGLLPTIYLRNTIEDATPYDFSRKADIIVVDAGATDVNGMLLKQVMDTNQYGISLERSAEITMDFFRELCAKNPGVKIIWCYGLTNNSSALKKHINTVISALGGEDAGFYCLEMKTTARRGFPSASEYEQAAERLCQMIRRIA